PAAAVLGAWAARHCAAGLAGPPPTLTTRSPDGRILLVDADAFYVAVARLVDPAGAGQAPLLIVGGSAERRGVVTSASYEARAYGVHSAMPMAGAVRLCPNATVVPVPWEACAGKSREIKDVLQRFTPAVDRAASDEVYLDLTGAVQLYGGELLPAAARVGDAGRLAGAARRRVARRTGARYRCLTGRAPARAQVDQPGRDVSNRLGGGRRFSCAAAPAGRPRVRRPPRGRPARPYDHGEAARRRLHHPPGKPHALRPGAVGASGLRRRAGAAAQAARGAASARPPPRYRRLAARDGRRRRATLAARRGAAPRNGA